MNNDLVRKNVAPSYAQPSYPSEDFDVAPDLPHAVPPPGYGYSMGKNLNPGYTNPNNQQRKYVAQKSSETPAGLSTYPTFKDNPCKPSPPSNGDVKEAEYEKFINWFLNTHIGKTWVLVDFILSDGRRIQGSVMNIVNLSYRSNPKPSEMGVEIIINDSLYKGFICLPLAKIQLEKVTIANSQHQW